MIFDWDEKNNALLKKERWMSFEEIVARIESWDLIAVEENKWTYKEQHLIYLQIEKYVWVVPCLIIWDQCRLITAYPSRVATKRFI